MAAMGAVCMSRHVTVNNQGETQATTSLQAKKSKHAGETETENKQFLELQTQTGQTTASVWLSKALPLPVRTCAWRVRLSNVHWCVHTAPPADTSLGASSLA